MVQWGYLYQAGDQEDPGLLVAVWEIAMLVRWLV